MSMSRSLSMPSLKEQIVEMLKSCYDPEIPFNIVDLGLIYGLDVDSDGNVTIKMTLTSPGCPVGPWLTDEITSACTSVLGVKQVKIEITFEPAWSREMMSDSAHKALGF
jgi:FeS assembly SUF system protein